MARLDAALARLRVPLHFVLAAVLLVFAEPSPALLLAGSLVVAAGLAVRAWAAGYLDKEGTLTVTGPYAYVRHPLYLGTAIVLVGFALAGGRAGLALAVALYFVVLFVPAMRREAKERQEKAPEVYRDYAVAVPALVPRLRRFPQPGGTAGFQAQLYRRNREWRAAAGGAALLTLLYLKMVWG
ncbi:MAG: methyltransferase family protein [Terriglobia bacterium]